MLEVLLPLSIKPEWLNETSNPFCGGIVGPGLIPQLNWTTGTWDHSYPKPIWYPKGTLIPVCDCLNCHCQKPKVVSSEEGIEVVLAVPGYTHDEIAIEWKDDLLVITLTPNEGDRLPWKAGIKRKEITTIVDGGHVDTQKMKAKLENGVLVIKAPYLDHRKPVMVEIK